MALSRRISYGTARRLDEAARRGAVESPRAPAARTGGAAPISSLESRWATWRAGAAGIPIGMEVDVLIDSVEEVETRSGKIRYVVRDADGKEYTTFRPAIGREATKFQGRHAHIAFHEEERNGFHNVYLDAISETIERPQSASGNTDPDEVAWNTAVEAAPWMLGSREPQEEIPPEELYEKLEPFKRLVADDIRQGPEPADD